MIDLAIRGGTVFTESGSVRTDVGIADGRIVQINSGISGTVNIDARGMLVLPGGIDMHVHFESEELSHSPIHHSDDFASGSRAAVAGGITTVGNITFPLPDESMFDAVERTAAIGERDSLIDFILHPVLLAPTTETHHDIRALANAGYPTMKIFLVTPSFDAHIDAYMAAIQSAGAHGIMTLLHCEDGPTTRFLSEQLIAKGHGAPADYAASRPVYSETVAVDRAIAIAEATAAPIYIVHLSSEAALDRTNAARQRGVAVHVETRPIYLLFTDSCFEQPDGALYIGNPPLRKASDMARLWEGLARGEIDTIASDHAPWTRSQKLDKGRDVATALPGLPDVETLLPLLFSEGVRKKRISLERFVDLTSTTAARLAGLYPRKGVIAVGSDADIAVWDPDQARTVRAADGCSRAGFSLYDGWDVVGWPVHTISRGRLLFLDRLFTDGTAHGQLLRAEGSVP